MLKIALIASVCMFIFRQINPETQSMRIARAALVAGCMLVVLAIIRSIGA
jgi:hypothetical protein